MGKFRKTESAQEPHSPRTEQIHRLNRLAGQISGVARMIEEGRAIGDVLIQLKAARSGLDAVERRLIQLSLQTGLDAALLTSDREDLRKRLEALFDLAADLKE